MHGVHPLKRNKLLVTCYKADELLIPYAEWTTQTQSITCMVSFIGNIQGRLIHRDRLKSRGYKGIGRGNGEWLCHRYWDSFWEQGKCLKPRQRWWLHKLVHVINTTELQWLKWLMAKFMLCKLYLNWKKTTKKIMMIRCLQAEWTWDIPVRDPGGHYSFVSLMWLRTGWG